ncbi:type II toxin-antitoxin system YoeB family toxin [Nocardia sp. NEAU-G5]|uniref:Endoribonuclease YoeB n=1 Tax=Nocardia albiluteola TaxID=2842303 RepID=A0ABS6AW65_9NOCA|nr:type II toxin-antitoxin system YoeB family toxin [Nocardia albiluteola]MBU3061785.1 type II toxin-antitoxin system YoeB family toxin [Nocardia albiluteola]
MRAIFQPSTAPNVVRRITQEHRLIYYVTDTEIVVVQVGGRYGD